MLNLWNVLDEMMRTDPWFRPLRTSSENVSPNSWPLVDVTEGAEAYLIEADLPGVKLEDVKIEIDNNVLALSAERHTGGTGQHHSATFSRSFVLPRGVQADGVQATMKDGVLSIRVAKGEQAARARRIPVQIAGSASAAPAQISAQTSADTVGTAAG